MHKVEHKEYDRAGPDKVKKKNWVPDKVRRTTATYYIVKQNLVAWGDLFSNSDESKHPEDISMMVIEYSADSFNSTLCIHGKV